MRKKTISLQQEQWENIKYKDPYYREMLQREAIREQKHNQFMQQAKETKYANKQEKIDGIFLMNKVKLIRNQRAIKKRQTLQNEKIKKTVFTLHKPQILSHIRQQSLAKNVKKMLT